MAQVEYKHPACRAEMRRQAWSFMRIALGFLLLVHVTACAQPPSRDSEADHRRLQSVSQNQPTPRESIDQEASAFQVRRWIRDLDSDDDRIFTRATQGIRDNVGRLPAVLENTPLPKAVRGKRALIELLANTVDRSVAPDDFWRRLTGVVIGYASLEPAGEGQEGQDELSLRLSALAALRVVDPVAAAPVMRDRLFDPTREVRWAAAAYFRGFPAQLNIEVLRKLVQELRHESVGRRADALLLLVHIDQRFQEGEGRANRTGISFDPYASELVRIGQLSAWDAWLGNAEARLAALIAIKEPEPDGD